MAKTAIVVHACGFSSEKQICPVFKSRLRKAKTKLESLDTTQTIVIITGGVPFKNGSQTLARCGGEYFASLFKNNQPIIPIFYAENCFNSSTDTIDALLMVCGQDIRKKYIVVSSFWHNWILRQTYKTWSQRLGCKTPIIFISPDNDLAGYKTVLTYVAFYVIMKSLNIAGLNDWFENFMNRKQKKRTEGFPLLGCD